MRGGARGRVKGVMSGVQAGSGCEGRAAGRRGTAAWRWRVARAPGAEPRGVVELAKGLVRVRVIRVRVRVRFRVGVRVRVRVSRPTYTLYVNGG